ncbi:MAG: hypothetical protein ABIN01_21705 [Ferruginibacter sp.]
MRNLESIIDEYLSKSTDYAVQIVGGWGYGKTFYYRDKLEKLIYNKSTFDDATKKYKPIYISLFGLKSVEDIATKMVLEFYQSKLFKNYFQTPLRKKKLKITESVLKIGLRGFLNFNMLGDSKEYLTDIKNIGRNVLDTKELVVCFDDLERKDSSLNIEDLTGYINSLVDEGIKVLLISNEDLLLEKAAEYKNLKEKIIGISIEFVPNTMATLQNIIKLRYAGFSHYKSFLTEHFELIERFSYSIKNNFRHIIYALDNLQYCYSLIKKEIFDIKHEISDKLQEQIVNISALILALSAEYKSSNLKFGDIGEYRHDHKSLSEIFSVSDEKGVEVVTANNNKFNSDTLSLKYNISKENYHFFDCIYNYVTGFEEFNSEIFIIEFIRKFNLEKGKMLPHYELLHLLGYQNCFNLSDADYKEKTLQLLQFAYAGLFQAADYLTIMHFAERLDNVLELDLEEVKNNIVRALQHSLADLKINSELTYSQFEMSGRMSDISEENKLIHSIGMKEICSLREQNKNNQILQMALMLIDDSSEFQNRYNNNSDFKNEVSYRPILNYMPSEKFVEFISSAKNEKLFFVRSFFEDRYKNFDKLEVEYHQLKDITIKLNNLSKVELEKDGKTVRNYLINQLLSSLLKLVGFAEKRLGI